MCLHVLNACLSIVVVKYVVLKVQHVGQLLLYFAHDDRSVKIPRTLAILIGSDALIIRQ